MTSLIEARGLGKRYGNVVALADVSTRVDAGSVTCILGDNGAGKSTLIKILAVVSMMPVWRRGRSIGDHVKGAVTAAELTALMAGGSELDDLSHELGTAPQAAVCMHGRDLR